MQSAFVDTDLDRILRIDNELPLVLTTDYSCMEMYLFDEYHLTKCNQVNGHDFITLLQHTNKAAARSHGLQTDKGIRTALLACAEPARIASEPLFAEIISRVTK
jgi:hypothetical protein